MPANPNSEILNGVRSLLLTFDDLTPLVSDRIRPEAPETADGNQPQVILSLPTAEQFNVLDRIQAYVNAELHVTVRATTSTLADQISEIIRSQNTTPSTGLDGYSGMAGSGTITSSERTALARGKVYDDDGDETELFEVVQVFDVWFTIQG